VPRPSISGEAPEDNRAQLSGEQQRLDRLYQALEHGRRQAAMGRYHQAAMHFTEAVRLDPDNADARYRLALACVRCGRVPAARRHMQALEQLDPNRASLLRNLVRSRVPLAAVPLPTDGRSRHAPCHR